METQQEFHVIHYRILRVMMDAGLPPGVINFLPGPASVVGDTCLASPDLAGIHFTGSTGVFRQLWREVGERIASYRSYPRIVGKPAGRTSSSLTPIATKMPLWSHCSRCL